MKLTTLFYWIEERERIRKKKLCGEPRPWTTDPILDTFKFCNVRREDDRVTEWIRLNWREPYAEHPNLALAMVIARLVNWPDTLRALGFPEQWHPNRFQAVLGVLKDQGRKVWTGAYMVTGGYSAGGESKAHIIARVITGAQPLTYLIKKSHTLAEAHYLLSQAPGLGDFLTAQVIADLKYTPLLRNASDWYNWCAPGPGSTKGLNYVMERPIMQSVDADQFREEVGIIRKEVNYATGLMLCAQDTQNCLCELSKYVRAQEGGRLKTRYVPTL